MDRLLREGNPPVDQLASPIPQYKKPGSTDYEAVEGQHGAPFAILKDASGNIISPATDAKLEQVKTELELVKSELEAIKANQTSGDQKVQLSGTIVRDVLGYFSTSAAGSRKFFGATRPVGGDGTLQPLDIRGFKKISIHFLNGSPTHGTRNKLRVTFHRTLDVQEPGNAFPIAPQYEFKDVPANGSFRLLLTSDLSDLAGTPPDGLAIRYLPDLVGLVFSYDQASSGNSGDKIILFSGVR